MDSFEGIMKIFEGIPAMIQDASTLIQISQMPKYKIKNKEIHSLREEFRKEIIKDQ